MSNPPCPNCADDETKRILGELAILVDAIRIYLREMNIEGALLDAG